MHMTRAQLIPYAKKGWELWMNTSHWLSKDIDVERKMDFVWLSQKMKKAFVERSRYEKIWADIKIISRKEAQQLTLILIQI